MKYILAVFFMLIGGMGIEGIGAAFPSDWTNPQFIVETDWLEKNLGNPNLAVIHIAPNRDLYSRGHIPGSVFISYKSILNPAGQ